VTRNLSHTLEIPDPSVNSRSNTLRIPQRLVQGDLIGIISPASAAPDVIRVERAVSALKNLEFRVKLGRHVGKRLGFLAGDDRSRAEDLMRMFADRSVRAILCVRGGYGSARLLPRLDYGLIRRNAKIFVGYSDITSLHCAFLKRARMVSFHGPMLNGDFGDPKMPDFTLQSFLRTLSWPTAPGDISSGYHGGNIAVLRKGIAVGKLIGGNLSLLCTTIGTPWQPDFARSILFLEEVNEEPYRFDRLLTHLLNCGVLQQVRGIAIGINRHCEDPKKTKREVYRQTLEEVMQERLRPLRIPVVTGLPFGHVPHNATLPVGIEAELDANRGVLRILQPAVF